MIGVLSWILRKLGVQTISCWILLSSALSSVALGLGSMVRGLDAVLVLTVTALGFLMGWMLAKSRMPGWLATLFALGLGVGTTFLRVGQLGGEFILLVRAWAGLTWRVWTWQITRPWPDPQPALKILTQFVNDVATLAARLRDWLLTLANGTPAFDPVAVALMWSFILWLVAAWAAWSVRRRERPFDSLIPALALLGAMLAYVGGNPAYLIPALGALLLLMVLLSAGAREHQWNLNGIDFAEEIRFDLALISIPLSLLLLVVAAIAPSLSVAQVARYVQRSFSRPASESNTFSDSLGLIQQPKPESVFDAVRTPGLPRLHLLGAGPELSKQLVLSIRVDDPPSNSPSRYYWRSTTYEQYTGQGWTTNATEIVAYQAGERTLGESPPTQRLVRQDVQVLGGGGLVIVTGALVTADHDFQVAWRSQPNEDIFGANIDAKNYRVESLVPVAGELELRAAGSNYPEWIRARYLDLPEVPDRVLALARDLTATAPTPYDRARAIEAYLREFPYTLDLPAPPANRDVADYFLFDLKRGYCDYYATAMVVLARAAGLPARLVVGYAPGTYDPAQSRYVITEADAHSWAEVYFPNYGWIEFEPTGGRAPIDRAAEAPLPEKHETKSESGLPADVRLEPTANWWFALPGGIALLALGLFIGLTLDGWRLRRLAPGMAIDRIYMRLGNHGRRLGLPSEPSDTPGEILGRWEERLAVLADPRQGSTASRRVDQDIRWLIDVYVRRRYSPRRPDAEIQIQAIQTWERLRARLWSTWIRRIFQRLSSRMK